MHLGANQEATNTSLFSTPALETPLPQELLMTIRHIFLSFGSENPFLQAGSHIFNCHLQCVGLLTYTPHLFSLLQISQGLQHSPTT